MAVQTKKKKKMTKTRIAFILFACSFPVLNWLVFYVYANLSSFTMAFTNKDGILSLDNFLRFGQEFVNGASDIRIAIRNTFITFGILLVTYPFKVLVSYFIYKKVPGAKIYRVLFFLPTIIFSVAVSMIFKRMVGVQGPIAQWVQDFCNLEATPELLADSRFANIVVLLHMVWLQFPGDLVIWGGTFARIPEDVLESGRIDGVNWWGEFTKIIVPMVWPTVSLQMVLMFCGIFGASGAVFLLTGGGYGSMTISTWMYNQLLNMSGSQYTSNAYNYLSSVGLVLRWRMKQPSILLTKMVQPEYSRHPQAFIPVLIA